MQIFIFLTKTGSNKLMEKTKVTEKIGLLKN